MMVWSPCKQGRAEDENYLRAPHPSGHGALAEHQAQWQQRPCSDGD